MLVFEGGVNNGQGGALRPPFINVFKLRFNHTWPNFDMNCYKISKVIKSIDLG